MKGTMQTLTKYETTTLQGCEQVIEEGKRTFVDVGNALMKIRDGKLYRVEFDTFEGYCQKRWGWTRQRSNQLIDAASVVSNLTTTVVIPSCETQARPLAKLEPEQQREAWQRAQDRAQAEQRPVTAADVSEAVTYTIDPVEGSRVVTPDREESQQLYELKRAWKRTNKADRNTFCEWANIERK
jgi:hypothetical protein